MEIYPQPRRAYVVFFDKSLGAFVSDIFQQSQMARIQIPYRVDFLPWDCQNVQSVDIAVPLEIRDQNKAIVNISVFVNNSICFRFVIQYIFYPLKKRFPQNYEENEKLMLKLCLDFFFVQTLSENCCPMIFGIVTFLYNSGVSVTMLTSFLENLSKCFCVAGYITVVLSPAGKQHCWLGNTLFFLERNKKI